MPIEKSEFDSGVVLSELEKSAVSFLENNRNNAFTMLEIMDGIDLQTDYGDLWKAIESGIIIFGMPTILSNLVAKGKIKTNIIKGILYYMTK
jgi:hypothetical protein